MNTKKRKRPTSKMALWATAVALSLTMGLGPAQNSFAGNTPVVPPHLKPNTSVGTADGGGGIVDVDRIGTGAVKHNDPSASVYDGRKTTAGGGSFGVLLFEVTPYGYYRIVVDVIFLRFAGNLNPTANSGGPQHE